MNRYIFISWYLGTYLKIPIINLLSLIDSTCNDVNHKYLCCQVHVGLIEISK